VQFVSSAPVQARNSLRGLRGACPPLTPAVPGPQVQAHRSAAVRAAAHALPAALTEAALRALPELMRQRSWSAAAAALAADPAPTVRAAAAKAAGSLAALPPALRLPGAACQSLP